MSWNADSVVTDITSAAEDVKKSLKMAYFMGKTTSYHVIIHRHPIVKIEVLSRREIRIVLNSKGHTLDYTISDHEKIALKT